MAFEGAIQAFPEYGRPRRQLLERARELTWYHTMNLGEFESQGIFALDEFLPFYLLPESLANLDCLDVGTGNGYWAFLMEKRGAKSVVATDIADYFDTDFSILHGQPPLCPARNPEGAYGEPYRVAATLMNSRVVYKMTSAYDLSLKTVGLFDLVFSGSMLMHLFGPLLALQRMATVCRNALVVTTQTDLSLDRESCARFRGHQIPYVHFIPSPTCLVNMLMACGFEKVLRGPTFFLRFRDRVGNPDELVHTTVIGLKSAEHPCFELPRPRMYHETERLCRIEFVSRPQRVAPGETFDVCLSVENTSSVDWRGDGTGMEISLELEATLDSRSTHQSGSSQPPAPVVDLLPHGTSTLVQLKVVAPAVDGMMRLKPVMIQGSSRFVSPDTPEAIIRVRS